MDNGSVSNMAQRVDPRLRSASLASTPSHSHAHADRHRRCLRGASASGPTQRRGVSASASAASALEVRDLTYMPASASRPLLNGVTFDLAPGRIGLIFGPSGSGKSTLLNVLAGFCTSYDGEVVLQSGSAGRAMRDVGVVFQFPERYFVGNTIMEELSFGWRHSNSAEVRSEFVASLQSVLRVTGLSHLPIDQKLAHLSGGYQRRVAIAVQLLRKPSVLLLDEPTAGMDLPSIQALCATLVKVKQRSAVLVVSHDTELLLGIADDVWEMKSGGYLAGKMR